MTAPRFLEARARLPRLGMIRLGVVEGSGRTAHPREVDYFVLPTDLRAKYGEQPKRLPVVFPSDEIGQFFEVRYERRGTKKLHVACEGPGGTSREFAENGTVTETPCRKLDREPCECGARAKGHISVILPEGGVGCYWLLIGGEQRLSDLWTELRLYKATFGKLTGIVFELVREPTDVTVVTPKGRLVRVGWPVHCRVALAAHQAFAIQGVDVRALPGGQVIQHALPPAPVEDEDEAAPEVTNGEAEPSRAHRAQTEASLTATDILGRGPDPLLAAGRQEIKQATGAIGHKMLDAVKQVYADTPRPDDAPYDISMCFAAAAKCGVSPELYEKYLVAYYGAPGSDLPDVAVAKEAVLFRKAVTEGERMTRKADLIRSLNEALKKKANKA